MANYAIIGMGVMGRNLAKNFAEKGYDIFIYNRTAQKTLDLMDSVKQESYAKRLHPVVKGIKELVNKAGKKGIYFIIVKAGDATQEVINSLAQYLEKGAAIVDLANSNFHDTIKRERDLSSKGISFFGVGISGGEKGARYGPSLMAGGNKKEYDRLLKKLLEDISAKAHDNKASAAYLGKSGAGHFVKMVHNAIEYADMELIAESYDLMSRGLGMGPEEIGSVFEQWSKAELGSYLIEIAAKVVKKKDSLGKGYLIDKILDKAKMKGTGTWALMTSLELENAVPMPSMYGAVEARAISWEKEKRLKMSKKIRLGPKSLNLEKKGFIKHLEKAILAAKISAYSQGIDLMAAADKKYGFGLDIAKIAEIWRSGCIIRADFLDDISSEYNKEPDLISLMASQKFLSIIKNNFESLDVVCRAGISSRIPLPAFDSSRAYMLQSFSEKLPASLIQAMRDFFGSHTYERIDKPGSFHTQWE